jgi:O-methyltransferase
MSDAQTDGIAQVQGGPTLKPAENLYLDLLKKCLTASLYDESAWHILEGTRRPQERRLARPVRWFGGLMRQWLVGVCRKRSLLLVRKQPFQLDRREEGRDWPCFGYAMTGHRRLENIQRCVEEVLTNKVPGDFIETGVWRGGATMFMRALLKVHGVTDRTVWVADSFEGLPAPADRADGPDLSHVEQLAVSLEQVKANFTRFGLLDDQVQFLKGWFRDTLPHAPIKHLAILRLDGDLYGSTMDSLCALYHRVSPGGFVIVDDYHCLPACRRAVTDFLQKHQINAKIQKIDWTGVYWKVEGNP